MNFFVVSAGKPGSDYVEDNFEEIIKTNEFALHINTNQKGTYFSIESKDVLILKYERKFVAYGIVEKRYENPTKDFALRAKEEEIDRIFLEDKYDDIEKNKEVDERLKSIDKSIFPEDLFREEN